MEHITETIDYSFICFRLKPGNNLSCKGIFYYSFGRFYMLLKTFYQYVKKKSSYDSSAFVAGKNYYVPITIKLAGEVKNSKITPKLNFKIVK